MTTHYSKPSSLVTYFLWFFFGVFGFHHLYLNNTSRAIISFLTLNYCFLGWLYDFLNLDKYIDLCSVYSQATLPKIPSFSLIRMFFNFLSSLYFSSFIYSIFPSFTYFYSLTLKFDKSQLLSRLLLEHHDTAYMIHTLLLQYLIIHSNILGLKFYSSSVHTNTSYGLIFLLDIAYFAFVNKNNDFNNLKIVFLELTIINAFIFEAKRRRIYNNWKNRKYIIYRFIVYCVGIISILLMGMVILGVNLKIPNEENGKNEPLYKVFWRFYKGNQFKIIFKAISKETGNFYFNFRTAGARKAFERFASDGNEGRIDEDLEMLGLDGKNVTWKEIQRAYKKQAIKWHPDITKEDVGKAHKKMERINAAYERLKKIYSN